MPEKEQVQETFTRKHWAQLHGISARTLDRAIKSGQLRCYKFGRSVRISKAQFESYLASLEV